MNLILKVHVHGLCIADAQTVVECKNLVIRLLPVFLTFEYILRSIISVIIISVLNIVIKLLKNHKQIQYD